MAGVNTVTGTSPDCFASYSGYTTQAAAAAGSGAVSQADDVFLQAQQSMVDKQVSEFGSAVQQLNSKLKAFAKNAMFERLYDSSSTSNSFQTFALSSVRGLVKAYNNVNGMIKSADHMTGEAAKLLTGVQQLLQGKNGKDYAAMGLVVDKNSGSIKLDEKKFADFLTDDAAKVKKLLIDKKYLAPMLQNIVQDILGKNEDYYFTRPFSVYA